MSHIDTRLWTELTGHRWKVGPGVPRSDCQSGLVKWKYEFSDTTDEDYLNFDRTEDSTRKPPVLLNRRTVIDEVVVKKEGKISRY